MDYRSYWLLGGNLSDAGFHQATEQETADSGEKHMFYCALCWRDGGGGGGGRERETSRHL